MSETSLVQDSEEMPEIKQVLVLVWCGFPVFILKAYQEVLKRLIHGDMPLFHEVKKDMAELDLNAQGHSVMFHD
ncbi:hypothetical protein HGM15179_009226 [Zosterops borbonicus]|uniref:Uncharacterized protein n=1 Tax=Zosterops borbonicus TaxID=364589 RepID=A0A8K1LL79_9PASS|nr:hypothetical protein HGM15179_009226 [Zosterops borbonicus]